MLTISNYSGVGKSHPRRGLFNSFGSRSGKVNYRWDLLDIDFDFIEWFIKKKWRKTMQLFSFRDSELQVRQRDSMTQWQNDKMTKGRTDKKQVKQNWLPNDDFYCWHWNERGLKIWFMLKKNSTVQKLESSQPMIFMRYLNVDRFSGRRRKKSWITWWERRYTTLGSVPRESIKLVYMLQRQPWDWIEIITMTTTETNNHRKIID